MLYIMYTVCDRGMHGFCVQIYLLLEYNMHWKSAFGGTNQEVFSQVLLAHHTSLDRVFQFTWSLLSSIIMSSYVFDTASLGRDVKPLVPGVLIDISLG